MKRIEVFGPGCPKCKKLAQMVEKTAAELEVPCEITKVTDIQDIVAKGIMLTPGLAIDGKLVSVGKLPSASDLRQMLTGE